MAETVWNVSAVDGQHEVPEFIDPRNYASDKKVAERAWKEVVAEFPRVREFRAKMTDNWKRYYAIYKGNHTISFYDGEADLRLRMGRKIIDTRVAQTKGRIFPSQPFYMVDPVDPIAQEKLPVVQKLLDHDIEQANLKGLIDFYLVMFYVFGFAIFKNYWKIRRSRNYAPRLRRGPGGERNVTVEPQDIMLYEGPVSKVINPFRLYIMPQTAETIEEAEGVFEDIGVTWSFLKTMEEQGVYWNVQRVKDDPQEPSTKFSKGSHDIVADRDELHIQEGYNASDEFKVGPQQFALTECWCNFDLYGDGKLIPCKITAIGEYILEVRQNPLFHQEVPYRMARMADDIDNVYGQGLMSLIEDYQYAIDALVNQGIDSVNFQTNPIVLVNEDVLDTEKIKIAPRAKWSATGAARLQDAARIIRPPDTASDNFNTVAMIMGMMQDIAAAPPISQGKTGDRDVTATEGSLLAQGAAAFTDTMAAKLEAQVLSKLLRDYYMLEQQFRMPSSHARITGTLPIPVDIQDLVGDYKFRWFVSQGAQQELQVKQINGGITAGPAEGGDQNAGMIQQLAALAGQGAM